MVTQCVDFSQTQQDVSKDFLIGARCLARSHKDELNIAQAAPWLQNASLEIDSKTFPIFAARQEQISHALKNLAIIGTKRRCCINNSFEINSLRAM